MALLIFYLLLALLVSFLCSVMEAVLLSTPMSFINVKEAEGHKSATVLKKIKENLDKPLSAILSLNTIAHTIGAAGVGAQAVKVFGDAYIGIVSAVLTILILVLSEIIPKTIGTTYNRELALISARIINVMIIIAYPLVIIAEYITRSFSKSKTDQTVSREEISAMANIGTKEGIFEEKENKIIQNLIRLRDVNIDSIMTPRVVVSLADENMSLEEFLTNKTFMHYSRIPVYSENRDNITGYIFRQLVFEKLAVDETNIQLKDIRRNIVVAHSHQPVLSVWEMLLDRKEHIALVVDEYGGMDGIVTMEDIIESLLGLEIVDEKDHVRDMQQFARDRWNERKAKYNILE
jgi:CBS domain containing-hemolysin-like protein